MCIAAQIQEILLQSMCVLAFNTWLYLCLQDNQSSNSTEQKQTTKKQKRTQNL